MNAEAAKPHLLCGLAFANASADYKHIISAMQGEPTLSEITEACSKVGTPQHMATIQADCLREQIEKILTRTLAAFQQNNNPKVFAARFIGGQCYKCGKHGHLKKNCPESTDKNIRALPKMLQRKTSLQRMLLKNRCGWKTFATSGKLEHERGSSMRNDTNNGDDSSSESTGGTVIREHESDSLSRNICRIPGDPELLPPGAQCDLATSRMVYFMDRNHAVIPTGVTGMSWKRQEFLIIGRDRRSILGLIIYPSIISANQNEELTVLAQALRPPLTVPKNTSIAKAIALPSHATEQVMPVLNQQFPSCGEHAEVHAMWVKQIGRDRPIIVCDLICNGQKITIEGILDTGADVTVISYLFWPEQLNLVTPVNCLSGIGRNSFCLQSENTIIVSGPGGKTALICPFIVQKPITGWGRDILAQWGTKLEMDFS